MSRNLRIQPQSLAAIANKKGAIPDYSILRMQPKLEQRGVQPMNSALRNQIIADRRRDRRNDIIASVIGWAVTIAGAFIGAALFYTVTFTFLSIGL